MSNQVKKKKEGEMERSVILEFINKEMVCKKNLVLLKVHL